MPVRGGTLSAKGLAFDGLQLPLQGLPALHRSGMVHGDDRERRGFRGSGNVIAMDFCAHCHGWLWNVPVLPGIKMVRVGTLDNMDWAESVGNIWTDSKAAWVKIDPKLVNFPKQAVDRTPLFEAWTRLDQE